MKMTYKWAFLIVLGLLGGPVLAAEICDELPAFTLKDQAGEPQTLSDSVQRIYANGDRSSGKLIKQAMTGLDQSTLDAQQAIVVTEISAAPGFVKGIIRSGLEDRSYTTWIDTKGTTKRILPYRADRVVVLELAQRKVTAIRYIADADSLKQELLSAAPATEAAPETPAEAVASDPTASE